MSDFDDVAREMRGSPFDDTLPDAVFAGAAGIDVPPELRDVVELVHAARRPASADELVDEDVVVARIAAAIDRPAVDGAGVDRPEIDRPAPGRPPRVPARRHRAKVVSIATAAMLIGGSAAAAAATGALPSPLQRSIAGGFAHVGISLPRPAPRVALKAAVRVDHPRHTSGTSPRPGTTSAPVLLTPTSPGPTPAGSRQAESHSCPTLRAVVSVHGTRTDACATAGDGYRRHRRTRSTLPLPVNRSGPPTGDEGLPKEVRRHHHRSGAAEDSHSSEPGSVHRRHSHG